MTLNDSEVATFFKDGFVLKKALFSSDEVECPELSCEQRSHNSKGHLWAERCQWRNHRIGALD